jgi:hypothetical protein
VTKVLSLRVSDDLAEWVDREAAERGVTRQSLLGSVLRSFRGDCEAGVSRLDAVAPDASAGVGKASREVVPYPMAEGVSRPVIPALSERERLAMRTDALRMMRLRAPESAHGRAKK